MLNFLVYGWYLCINECYRVIVSFIDVREVVGGLGVVLGGLFICRAVLDKFFVFFEVVL